jgi:hypothetical protein
MKLANFARVCSVQLSRRPEDLLVLLQSLQCPTPQATLAPQRINPKQSDRRFVPSLIKA